MSKKQLKNSIILPDLSVYLKELKGIEKRLRKSHLFDISSSIICTNENIFSFNKENLDKWEKIYIEANKNKINKKKTPVTNIVKDTKMKFIIKTRKNFLTTKLREILLLQSSLEEESNNQKIQEYVKNIDFLVQNILKYEFLGFCKVNTITSSSYSYNLFCYYIGENNQLENLKKNSNWKILPPTIIDSFHFNFKNTWQNYINLNENDAFSLEECYIFNLLDQKNICKENNEFYNEHFIKPKLLNKNDKPYIPKYDPRYFINRHQRSKLKVPLKRKREDEEVVKQEEEEVHVNKKQKLIDYNIMDNDKNHFSYGFKYAVNLTTEKDSILTIEDWKNRNLILPPNLPHISFDILRKFYYDRINIKIGDIDIDPSLIPSIILNAFNLKGVIRKCIKDLGIRNSETIINDNNKLSNIEEKILDKKNHEYIRNIIYSFINSLVIISMLT